MSNSPGNVENASLLLASILDSADDAIISQDVSGTITTWNKAAERIFGYTAEEVIGGPISVIIPPDRGSEESEILRRIGLGHRIEGLETLRVRKDGETVEVSITVSPVLKDGKVIGASKIARDISEPKRLLREMEQQKSRLEVTLASIGDGVIVTDANGVVHFMNPTAESLTGWKAAEARGQTLEAVFNIVNETTRRRVENPAARVLREGVIVGLANHTLLISKGGSEFSIDDTAAPIRAGSDVISGVVLIFRDVSGRRALDDFRARLAAIVESSDDAIIGKDLTGRITAWNAGATRLFGYTAQEAVGRPISILIPSERLSEETMILERLRRGERIEHLETVRLTKHRRKVDVALTISPIHDAHGTVVGASKIARDITERKQTERELFEARARLEKHSQELERTVEARTAELHAANQELSAFSYTVAHDLKSPLRGLRGILSILEEELKSGLTPEQRELFERLNKTSDRMTRLLDDLLKLSGLTKRDLQVEMTSMGELVRRAISELGAETSGREVQWTVGQLPSVPCDPGLLQQAWINLLGNALKYTRPRTVAKIQVAQTELQGERVFFVRDNGIGFNMEQAENLFRPFHRLHPERQFEGNGIGLATVEQIVRRHGGRVWAEAKVDQGATFYFTLNLPSP